MSSTKDVLAKSLLKLLQNNSLDKITVQDVVNEAGVNRQTFYYHFQDIFALVSYVLDQEIPKQLTDISSPEQIPQWRRAYRDFTDKLYANRTLVLNTYDAITPRQFESYLYSKTRPVITMMIDSESDGLNITAADREFLIEIYARGCAGLVISWMDEGMPDQHHVQLTRFLDSIQETVRTIITTFTAKNG